MWSIAVAIRSLRMRPARISPAVRVHRRGFDDSTLGGNVDNDAGRVDGGREPGRPITLSASVIGGPGDQYAFDLAFDSASNLFVAGVTDSPTDLGPATVNPSGLDDGFVVSYDRSLNPRWAFVIGSDDVGQAWELDQAANGRVYVTGVYRGASGPPRVTAVDQPPSGDVGRAGAEQRCSSRR